MLTLVYSKLQVFNDILDLGIILHIIFLPYIFNDTYLKYFTIINGSDIILQLTLRCFQRVLYGPQQPKMYWYQAYYVHPIIFISGPCGAKHYLTNLVFVYLEVGYIFSKCFYHTDISMDRIYVHALVTLVRRSK